MAELTMESKSERGGFRCLILGTAIAVPRIKHIGYRMLKHIGFSMLQDRCRSGLSNVTAWIEIVNTEKAKQTEGWLAMGRRVWHGWEHEKEVRYNKQRNSHDSRKVFRRTRKRRSRCWNAQLIHTSLKRFRSAGYNCRRDSDCDGR